MQLRKLTIGMFFRGVRAIIVSAALLAPVAVAAQQPGTLGNLRQAAEQGSAEAQFALAEALREGTGIPQNYAKAARWYQAAAGQDHAPALHALAGLHVSGLGVEKDAERGYDLAAAAADADAGNPLFIHDLARLTESGIGTDPDPARAAELYASAAAQGFQESAVALGVLYQEGKGVEQDFGKALELYTGPAEAGHARAQNNLGLIYSRGEGVEPDYAEAVRWFRMAGEQGLPTALNNLGVMYENGFGVEVDEDEAKRLYRLAASISGGATGTNAGGAPVLPLVFDPRLQPADPQRVANYRTAAQAGDPVAQFLLGYLRADAAQSNADYRIAAAWFQRAAESGAPAAMANLGVLQFEGKGALQDYVEGYKWLTLASVSGLPGVAALRDRFAERMTPGQIEAANALAEAEWAQQRGASE